MSISQLSRRACRSLNTQNTSAFSMLMNMSESRHFLHNVHPCTSTYSTPFIRTFSNRSHSHSAPLQINIHMNDNPTPPIQQGTPTPVKDNNDAHSDPFAPQPKIDVTDDDNDDSKDDADITGLSLRPCDVVTLLDKYIVGQKDAKKSVAVALRNRWRRQRLPAHLKNEVMPKNILMVGPTGVGKTEIARRVAKLGRFPFIKVEATRYTEVGFHGRDVDTIIRDLVDVAIQNEKELRKQRMKKKIRKIVDEAIVRMLVGDSAPEQEIQLWRSYLRVGLLEDQEVDVEVAIKDEPFNHTIQGDRQLTLEIKKVFGGRKTEKKKMKIRDARVVVEEREMEKLISSEDVSKEAIKSVENHGIVFIDEIDKICSTAEQDRYRADASAEGVQRDLLPLVEGCVIDTKHGPVSTDHILFIASGAFHGAKPSDLLPELQGRLPIRVELKALQEEDLHRILTVPVNNLILQAQELLKTEAIHVNFTQNAVKEIAKVAYEANRQVENIGARRLHAIIERVMEDISYSAPEVAPSEYVITPELVREKVGDMVLKTDLSKYIL